MKKILSLSIKMEPESPSPGSDVLFSLNAKPKQTVKAELVEGDITCRRYPASWLKSLDKVGLSALTGCEKITCIIFSMGRDLIFLENSNSAYSGFFQIPEDAEVNPEDSSPIRWTITARVHIKDHPVVSVVKDFKVIPAKSEPKNVTNFPPVEETSRLRQPSGMDSGVVIELESKVNNKPREREKANRFEMLEFYNETKNTKEG